MHLDGSHVLNASPKEVWDMLQNPEILAKVTPGIKTLEQQGPDIFDAISEVKIGPVSGSFKGMLEVKDKVEPERFTFILSRIAKLVMYQQKGQSF